MINISRDGESKSRRSKLEIYYLELKLSSKYGGQTRTDVCKKIGTSSEQINNYVEELCNLEMLETYNDGKTLLSTTIKGKRFIRKFNYLIKQIS